MEAGPNETGKDTVMTIEEYLRGCVGFSIEDNAIATILTDRNILRGTPVCELSKSRKTFARRTFICGVRVLRA